jgi:hypothetical protein
MLWEGSPACTALVSQLRTTGVCTALLQKFQSSILTFSPRKYLTTSSYLFPSARRKTTHEFLVRPPDAPHAEDLWITFTADVP